MNNFHKIRIEIEGPRVELFINEMPIPIRALEVSASMDAFPVIKAEIIPRSLPEPQSNEDIENLRHKAESMLQIYHVQKNLDAVYKYKAEREAEEAERETEENV